MFRRFAARAALVPKLKQSATQRARVDTSTWVSSAPIRFGLLTTCTVAGAGVLGALLASALPVGAQVVIAIGAACVGFVAPVCVVFAIDWLAAFPRQRNEARDEAKRLTQTADVAELSREFSDWVAAKRAGLPQRGLRMIPEFHDIGSEVWLNHERRQDEIASLNAKARADYHERFRVAVIGVLGADTADPEDVAGLEELAEKLRALAAGEERATRVAAAHGRPVGANHRALLDGLLTGVQLAAANQRAVDYGDAPDGEQHNRESFAAHAPASLMRALDTWHAAVERLERAVQTLRDWIPQEVQRRGFIDPEYVEGTVAECFSEVTVGRARRHELGEPLSIHLRCVQDVMTTEDGEKRWSAYLHSGRAEVKVAELSHEIKEFSDEGMADLNKVIAAMDHDLQACFDALQRSDSARQVADEQSALGTLQQPLVDQLKLNKITANPVFSESCPYCLSEIGL